MQKAHRSITACRALRLPIWQVSGLLLLPLSSQPGSANSAKTARLMQLPVHSSKRTGRCSFKAVLLTRGPCMQQASGHPAVFGQDSQSQAGI